jgi:hypothetical protein
VHDVVALPLGHQERTGAHGLVDEGLDPLFNVRARQRHHVRLRHDAGDEHAEHRQHRGVRMLQAQRDLRRRDDVHVVDGFDLRAPGTILQAGDAFERERHVVGAEGIAVGELHVLAELDRQRLAAVGPVPLRRQAGMQLAVGSGLDQHAQQVRHHPDVSVQLRHCGVEVLAVLLAAEAELASLPPRVAACATAAMPSAPTVTPAAAANSVRRFSESSFSIVVSPPGRGKAAAIVAQSGAVAKSPRARDIHRDCHISFTKLQS